MRTKSFGLAALFLLLAWPAAGQVCPYPVSLRSGPCPVGHDCKLSQPLTFFEKVQVEDHNFLDVDALCEAVDGLVTGPASATVGAAARFTANSGKEIGMSKVFLTNGDISGSSDYNGLASMTLGVPGAGGVTFAPCLVRFPSQFVTASSAFAAQSCSSPGVFGSATGELLAIYFGDEGGQPPSFVLTSEFLGAGAASGLILAGEYNTFTNQATRQISFSESDTIPALNNAVALDVGIIRKGVGLLQINDGTRDGTTFRDLTSRRGIFTTGVRITTATTPASASAACTTGDFAWDTSFIYLCVATNTWKRVGISTW